MTDRRDLALVVASLAFAVGLEAGAALPFPESVGDGAAGAALLASGALALRAPRGAPAGALMIAAGAAWFAGTWFGDLVFVHRAPLVLLVLAYPRWWPASPVTGLVAVIGMAVALVTPAARSASVTLALAVAIIVVAAARHRASAGIERRVAATALAAAGTIGIALAVAAIGRLRGGALDELSLWAYEIAVMAAALGLAADLRWGRWERAAVSELVADLGVLERPDALRERLARTLGDPALDLRLLPDPEPIEPPAEGRVVTYVEDGGHRVAALVHDRSLLDDPGALGAALAAARLMAANQRMAAEVRTVVQRLEASRRRLVEAAIEQRRALEEELRGGAERRLEQVAERLRGVNGGETVSEVVASVERAREDLRRFAQGIHPATLTDQGLRTALEEAAALMPVAVSVEAPGARLPETVEVTLYFLCTEALANVGKHANATRVDIEVRNLGDAVVGTVVDDGAGGADLAAGTGLRGLADRIEALGGELGVESPVGGGTRLHARVPI